MFGPLIVIYLFLAGAGCGTFVAAVYLSQRARSSAALRRSLGRVALPSLVVSCGMVAVGAACLMLDLGRPELALDKQGAFDAGQAVGDTITVTGFTRIQLAAE